MISFSPYLSPKELLYLLCQIKRSANSSQDWAPTSQVWRKWADYENNCQTLILHRILNVPKEAICLFEQICFVCVCVPKMCPLLYKTRLYRIPFFVRLISHQPGSAVLQGGESALFGLLKHQTLKAAPHALSMLLCPSFSPKYNIEDSQRVFKDPRPTLFIVQPITDVDPPH